MPVLNRPARVAAWALLVWVVAFWRLSYLPLLDPDEAHYTQITREMRALSDYVVPRIDGVPIIDKPALFHWIQAASFAAVGETALGARLPTALAFVALLLTVRWFGRRVFDAATADRAALMFALTPLTFILTHVAIFDMVFVAFLFGAIACLIVAAREARPRLQILAFVLLSLAVQIKGPFAVIIVVAAAAVTALSPAARPFVRRIHWVRGLIGAGVLALPWFLLMWQRFGQSFINDYVLYNNVQLFAEPLYRRRFDPFFYVRSAAVSLFPWSIVLVGAAIDAVRQRRTGGLSGRRLALWAWVAVVFGFFSASRFKLDHYVFPIVPAVCLLGADAWQRAVASGARRTATSWALLAAGVLLLAGGVAGTVILEDVDLHQPAHAVLLPVALGVGGGAWLVTLWRARLTVPRRGVALFATLVAVYVGVVLVAVPIVDATRPGARLASWLAARVQPTDHVVIFKQGRWKASLRFYVAHPVQQTTIDAELLEAWRRPGTVYGIMLEKDAEVLRGAGLPATVVHAEPAIVGTRGKVIREQIWGEALVLVNR